MASPSSRSLAKRRKPIEEFGMQSEDEGIEQKDNIFL